MKSQDKNTLAYLVQKAMDNMGLKQEDLAEKTGVKQPVISRLVNGGKNIGTKNIFEILKALNLLNDIDLMCSVGCDEELREVCKKVKSVRDSQSHWWDSLQQNINSFKIGADNEGNNIRCITRTGRAYRIEKEGRVIYLDFL